MARIVVVGAGVVALGTAMLLAGDGHRVIVLERDPEGPQADPVDAWERWQRPGLNQFRMAHTFLGGFRAVLDAELPGVPHVTGVRTKAGELFPADLVVDMSGRRSALPGWLQDIGSGPPVSSFSR
jgi:hypothetical protein